MPKTDNVLNPNDTVSAKTITEWTQEWWKWALTHTENPVADTTGGPAAYANNFGPVFFLAGGNATRTIEVAAGKPILLPMINAFDTEAPSPLNTLPDFNGSFTASTEKVINSFKSSVTDIFAEIDGVAVKNPQVYYEKTGIFSLGSVQQDSVLNKLGVPVGTDLPITRSGGYWLMIDGLTPGDHTLTFGGSAGPSLGLSAFSTLTHDTIHVT